jgi:hypothetical protein
MIAAAVATHPPQESARQELITCPPSSPKHASVTSWANHYFPFRILFALKPTSQGDPRIRFSLSWGADVSRGIVGTLQHEPLIPHDPDKLGRYRFQSNQLSSLSCRYRPGRWRGVAKGVLCRSATRRITPVSEPAAAFHAQRENAGRRSQARQAPRKLKRAWLGVPASSSLPNSPSAPTNMQLLSLAGK